MPSKPLVNQASSIFRKNQERSWGICLWVSLVAALFYGLIDLQTAFSGDWVVQDDARQHVFWLLRYVDPELFPNDAISDYFQSVAPWGYTSLYKLGIAWGFDPFVLSKLMPIPLRIITAYYFFAWCRTIFPVPLGCLISTLLLNQSLWLKDDLVSATPRAFLYPLFIAFLYYFSRQALIPCLLAIVGLSLFYPQMVFLAWGMLLLKLISWRGGKLQINRRQPERNFALVGLLVGFLVLLPYALKTSDYAPVITRTEALTMPEFHYNGRSNFFKGTIWEYLIGRGNAVLISTGVFKPVILLVGLFLPWLRKKSTKYSLAQKITPQFASVSQLLLVSLGMYLLAHAVLFKLHLPSRYTVHSLRIAINLCAGLTLTIWLDRLWHNWQNKYSPTKAKLLLATTITAIALISYINFLDPGSPTGYKFGQHPQLYKYLQQQPKDIVVASLIREADNLPSFAQRSVLVSREYAIPYQLGYYRPFSDRVRALISAQYSPDPAEVSQVIKQYKLTYWLLEDRSFDLEYFQKNRWLKQFQAEYQQALETLSSQQTPLILTKQANCTVVQSQNLTLLDTACLIKTN